MYFLYKLYHIFTSDILLQFMIICTHLNCCIHWHCCCCSSHSKPLQPSWNYSGLLSFEMEIFLEFFQPSCSIVSFSNSSFFTIVSWHQCFHCWWFYESLCWLYRTFWFFNNFNLQKLEIGGKKWTDLGINLMCLFERGFQKKFCNMFLYKLNTYRCDWGKPKCFPSTI